MKRLLDLLRAVFISPEVLTALIPFAVLLYWREPASLFTDEFSSDIKTSFGVGLVPLGFMVASYKLGDEIFSPRGVRKILLDWPNYYMLKNRVVLSLVFCGISLVLGVTGAFGVVRYKSLIGATLIFAGILSSVSSLATVAVARWKIRELFRE